MKLEEEILLNKFGQGLVRIQQLIEKFELLDALRKREFLKDFLYLIIQSKPKKEDIQQAIVDSRLKLTFTPCVLLRKGVASHDLEKLVNLPENELTKSFILLLSLFKIAYNRRFTLEKNNPDKWWYWDLSDDKRIKIILKS